MLLDILIEGLQDEKDREMRIGILEDNPSICDMLQVALELAGHRVSVHYKSSTFLATVIPPEHAQTTRASFDLLIIDLVLPETISGLQVVHYVKMVYPDLPILLISAASHLRIEAALEDLPGVNALRLLAVNRDQVCTTSQIVTYVWGYDGDGDHHLIKAHIRHLRLKIESKPEEPRYILTVSGVGYTLVHHPTEEYETQIAS